MVKGSITASAKNMLAFTYIEKATKYEDSNSKILF